MAQYKTGQDQIYYTDIIQGGDRCFAVCQDGSDCEVEGSGCYCDCGGNPHGDPWGNNARCQCQSSPRPPPVKEGGLMRRGGMVKSISRPRSMRRGGEVKLTSRPTQLSGGSRGGGLMRR